MKKDKIVELLCCIFGGFFGLHCFVTGKIKKGILYLFTFGLLGIGWIVDTIIILIKLLKKDKKTNIESKYDNHKPAVYHYHQQEKFNYSIAFPQTYEKEKSLYRTTKTRKLVNDYIVFDLETTGLDCNQNKIIEIGALKYKNNELVDKFNVLINPKEKLESKIIKLTGITDEMLKNCETIETVLPKFINFIEDLTLIAHNGSFDLGFVESNINKLKLDMIKNKNIDTLYLARRYIPESENHKLETLKKKFKLNYGSHRAIEDCYVTNYIYQYCKTKKEEEIK